jgi:glycine/D-amino acid oxidase-like deaminating enzyme
MTATHDETAGENFTCDDARWSAEFYPTLIRRMPPFAGLTPLERWAGLYEMTPDHNQTGALLDDDATL